MNQQIESKQFDYEEIATETTAAVTLAVETEEAIAVEIETMRQQRLRWYTTLLNTLILKPILSPHKMCSTCFMPDK